MKKIILVAVMLFAFCNTSLAQGGLKSPETVNNEPVFTICEQSPAYPGGFSELSKYIQTNLKYPKEAVDAGIGGKCFLKFIVRKDGHITDIKILRGVPGCAACDSSAVKAVEGMPLWIPAKQNGANVNAYFDLPINFSH